MPAAAASSGWANVDPRAARQPECGVDERPAQLSGAGGRLRPDHRHGGEEQCDAAQVAVD